MVRHSRGCSLDCFSFLACFRRLYIEITQGKQKKKQGATTMMVMRLYEIFEAHDAGFSVSMVGGWELKKKSKTGSIKKH